MKKIIGYLFVLTGIISPLLIQQLYLIIIPPNSTDSMDFPFIVTGFGIFCFFIIVGMVVIVDQIEKEDEKSNS